MCFSGLQNDTYYTQMYIGNIDSVRFLQLPLLSHLLQWLGQNKAYFYLLISVKKQLLNFFSSENVSSWVTQMQQSSFVFSKMPSAYKRVYWCLCSDFVTLGKRSNVSFLRWYPSVWFTWTAVLPDFIGICWFADFCSNLFLFFSCFLVSRDPPG